MWKRHNVDDGEPSKNLTSDATRCTAGEAGGEVARDKGPNEIADQNGDEHALWGTSSVGARRHQVVRVEVFGWWVDPMSDGFTTGDSKSTRTNAQRHSDEAQWRGVDHVDPGGVVVTGPIGFAMGSVGGTPVAPVGPTEGEGSMAGSAT